MGGPSFIASWLRMMFASVAAKPQIDPRDWTVPGTTASSTNGQRVGVAQAKRDALKAKRRKAHRARYR